MNICMVSFHSCPYEPLGGDGSGGMSVYLKELSSVLCANHDVKMDIFTRSKDPDIKDEIEITPGLRIIHLKGGPKVYYDRFQLFKYLPEFITNLQDFIQQKKRTYDLVYTHYWLSGLAGEWIGQDLEIPLVHTYHTLAVLKEKALGIPEMLERRMAEEHLASRVDRIISSSNQERDHLLKRFGLRPDDVTVVYPGVNRDVFLPSSGSNAFKEYDIKDRDLVFLYAGRIEPVKGLLNLVKALCHLKSTERAFYDRIRFFFIGGGDREKDIPQNQEALAVQKYAAENGLEDRIVFLGSKKQEQLKDYYSAADALVVPSLYESFGLVVVEALSCGIPVLVSSIGEMKTFIKNGKNGFSFLPDDPGSLAACLMKFASSKNRLWHPGKISKNIGQIVSWEKTAEGVLKVFRSLDGKQIKATTISPRGENPQPM